jgi:hypothetical protein
MSIRWFFEIGFKKSEFFLESSKKAPNLLNRLGYRIPNPLPEPGQLAPVPNSLKSNWFGRNIF